MNRVADHKPLQVRSNRNRQRTLTEGNESVPTFIGIGSHHNCDDHYYYYRLSIT